MDKKTIIIAAAIGAGALLLMSAAKKDGTKKKLKPVIEPLPLESITEAEYKSGSQQAKQLLKDSAKKVADTGLKKLASTVRSLFGKKPKQQIVNLTTVKSPASILAPKKIKLI